MDVITAHQNGISNVVASMGTAVTETQVNTLKKLSRNLILALDADTAGEEAMLRGVGYENTLNAEVRVIILPEGKDPDDVIKEDVKIWQELVDKALPIVDYTFNIVTSKLDLTTARDKSQAVERLLPVVAEIKDPVRQAHYIQKLARLVGVTERTLEAALSKAKPAPVRQRSPGPRPAAVTHALRPLGSNPREEYCLALLLQYPELKGRQEELSPEYFESSENREILTAWRETDDLQTLRENLDLAIHEHLEAIINKDLPATKNNSEQRFIDCVMELRKKYLRSLAARKAESGDAGADPSQLEEDIKISSQLRELDARKNLKRTGVRR
jgi:DNA primase